jgi:hypothetical protein
MITQDQIIKSNKIISIYDDDVRVIDFLSDLSDRGPIHGLEKFVRWGNHESACLLYNCPADGLVVLILYRSPFNDDKKNNLMLYAHRTIRGLIDYFKPWYDASVDGSKEIHIALQEITMLLFHEWIDEQDNNTQSNFLG